MKSLVAESAVRQLRREPAYSAMMIATLAIGIAAAAAIFSVVRGVILRPLPYADARSIVAIQEYETAHQRDQTTVASANLPRLRVAQSLGALAAFSYSEYVVSDDRGAERIIGARVDGDLPIVLGVRPVLGRAISNDETGPNPARVVVLSDRLWRRRFGADPAVIGRSMVLDGAPQTVVGVMPPDFEFPRNPAMTRDVDVWVPRRPASAMMMRRGMRDLFIVARLRKGFRISDAQRELTTIATHASVDDPTLNAGWGLRVIGVRDMIIGRVAPVLEMLAACVGMLVLIACANASAGGLARVTTKRQAHAVRIALGARPDSVERLLVAESLLLAAIAAVAALPLSTIIRGILIRIAPVSIPRQEGVAADGWTITFGIAVALVMGFVASIGPRIWLRRLDVTTLLADANRSSTGSRSRNRTLTAFVVTQLALGTVLLAATARLYASYAELNTVDPGFTSKSVTTATIALGGSRYGDPRARTALTGQLLEKVRALPGVDRAAVTSLLPMSGGLMSSGYRVDGVASDSSMSAALRAVSSDFFASLGIPIRQGRPIEQTDRESAVRVVVVNQALERQSFGGSSALGKSILVTPPGSQSAESFTIVGIAGDAKEKDLLGPATPVIYFSDQQASFPHSVLIVRSRAAFPLPSVQNALKELDPTLALDDIGSLASRVRSSYGLQLFLLTILGTFAASAAGLIAVGVYGAVSFTVNADLRSIGIRMALGATRGRILGALMRRTALHATAGCAIGISVALLVPRLLDAESLLGDSTFGAALAGIVAVLVIAVVGTAVPARRAAMLDSLAILRGD